MNKDLKYLLESGDLISKRTLVLVEDKIHIAYVTEYVMSSKLGPLKFWITWKDENCNDPERLSDASIYIHDARARLYFPAFLDTRIPPPNRVGLQGLMDKYRVKEYDKFDFVIATKGYSPIKRGLVYRYYPTDCPLDNIHAIDEVVREYLRSI